MEETNKAVTASGDAPKVGYMILSNGAGDMLKIEYLWIETLQMARVIVARDRDLHGGDWFITPVSTSELQFALFRQELDQIRVVASNI